MKKNWIIVAIQIIIIIFGMYAACFTGCTETENLLNPSEYAGEIWSVPSTVKVERSDTGFNDKGDAAINITAVKNEYESSQLYITPESDVDSFYLAATDLSDGKGNIIDKSNITVYYQKFINTHNERIPYKNGWYPDALIPIDNAKDGDELFIKANENGALWITFYIPKQTIPGVYTANYSLTIDNNTYRVPVTANVYDYTLTDKINVSSNFSIRPMLMVCGELDNSIEMREKHYEFFLDYRTALRYLPVETENSAERVAAAKKYFNETPCYSIYVEDILPLAEASTPQMNLLTKAYLYIFGESYMHYSDDRPGELNRVNPLLTEINDELNNLVNIIDSDTSGKYDSFKQIENWQSYIIDILNIIPDHFDRMIMYEDLDDEMVMEFLSLFNGYCPKWDTYNDQLRDQYLSILEENEATAWWYSCLAPTSPYGTYHIADTNLLSARTISWLQKKYNIQGNLYWATTSYAVEDNENIRSVNVYENIYRLQGPAPMYLPAGDGQIVYPGAAYGIYGPLPSTRLMSIRDGMEEYEMLLDLENNFKNIIDYYATENGEVIDLDILMEEFYGKVYYNGVMLSADGQRGLDFTTLRNTLIDTLCNIDDPCRFLMHTDIIPIQNKANVTLYASSDYSVKVNGQSLTPETGSTVKYVYELDLTQNSSANIEVKHKTNGETYNYNRFISLPCRPLVSFDSLSDVPEGVIVTETSTVQLNSNTLYSDTGKSLKFTVNSVITGEPSTDIKFNPLIKVPVSIFEQQIDFTNVNTFNFYIYNPGDEYAITVKLYSGNNFENYGNYVVYPGYNNMIVLIKGTAFSKLDNIDVIAIEYENAGTVSEPKQYITYLDSLYAVMK